MPPAHLLNRLPLTTHFTRSPHPTLLPPSHQDACVSSYYHAANPHGRGVPFDAWAFAWINGLFEHGRWSDHVAGWRAEAMSNPEQVGGQIADQLVNAWVQVGRSCQPCQSSDSKRKRKRNTPSRFCGCDTKTSRRTQSVKCDASLHSLTLLLTTR
jgi:hypothetical protein